MGFKAGDDRRWQRQLLALQLHAVKTDFKCFLMQSFAALHGGQALCGNWHLDLLADYLERLERGDIRRLIINMPPRYLKSLCVSVAWPAWLLAQNPAARVIVASYAASLSEKHSLDCRKLLEEAWYRGLFPASGLKRGENEKRLFHTQKRGFRLAASVGGALTGYGGDVLIVDDPLNPLQAESKVLRTLCNRWFEHTFSSRLNDKNQGKMLVVMQRVHPDDLSGYLLRKGGWEQLTLPAIALQTRHYVPLVKPYRFREGAALHPAREGAVLLEKLRHDLGSQAFAAQYLQEPVARGGGMIKVDWLGYYDTAGEVEYCMQSWDTAIKSGAGNDYSVGLCFGLRGGEVLLLDVRREKMDFPELRRAMVDFAAKWQPRGVLVEDKGSGQSLLQDLRREPGANWLGIMPRLDKLTRLAAVSPMLEAGRLKMPRNAAWKDAFESELLAFPQGRHDDQVDALSQFLQWLQGKERDSQPGMRRI